MFERIRDDDCGLGVPCVYQQSTSGDSDHPSDRRRRCDHIVKTILRSDDLISRDRYPKRPPSGDLLLVTQVQRDRDNDPSDNAAPRTRQADRGQGRSGNETGDEPRSVRLDEAKRVQEGGGAERARSEQHLARCRPKRPVGKERQQCRDQYRDSGSARRIRSM